MSFDQIVVLSVTAAAFLLFVTEALPIDMVGLVVLLALALSGVLSPEEAIAGFSSEAMITIACMFVLSAALIRAGALEAINRVTLAIGGKSKTRMIIAVMLAVAVSSAFVNNTPVVVIFLPVVLAVSGQIGTSPSRLLIPMSYASILGGTCTLLGTSTNLLVSQEAIVHGYPPIGMFDFSVPGMILAFIGFAFLATFGRMLLPHRPTVASTLSAGRVREFVTEVAFADDSPLVGRSFQEILAKSPGITPLMLIRDEDVFTAPLIANPRTQFARGGDVLLLKGDPGAINSVLERDGLDLTPELGAAMEGTAKGKTITLVELVINPNSPLMGRTLGSTDFTRSYGGAGVVGVLRREEHLRERLGDIRLRLGDTLLVVVDETQLDGLRSRSEFLLLEGVDRRLLRRDKAPLAVAIMIAVVGLATINALPLSILALSGVGLMILTGCLPIRLAYAAVDWSILMLIVGMFSLAQALDKTGLVHIASMEIVSLLQDLGPMAVLAGIYLLSALITSLISNNAVALLLTPIGLDVAMQLGYQPAPFVFAVLFGASACFATPMGYQTNLFIYGPGGYRFTDFMRVGVPLNLAMFVAAMFVIPWYWPFERILS